MGGLILDRVMSMGGRWVQSLASSLAGGSGLLLIAAVVAGLYLLKKLSKKIADKIGIGLGPLLALGVLAFACFGMLRAKSHRPAADLPPEILAAKAKEAAKAEENRDRWAKFERAQADAATLDAAIATMPMGGGPTPMMMMGSGGPMPSLPSIPLASSSHAVSTQGPPAVSHSSVASVSAAPASPVKAQTIAAKPMTGSNVASKTADGWNAVVAPPSAAQHNPASLPAASAATPARVAASSKNGRTAAGVMSGSSSSPAWGTGMGSVHPGGTAGGGGQAGGSSSQGSRSHGHRGMSADQVAAMHQLDAMTYQMMNPGNGMHPAAMHQGMPAHAGGGHPGTATHPGVTNHAGVGGHPLGHR